jgi:hypothetical protein
VHVPSESKLSVVPETVQTEFVAELNVTDNPDDAVADRETEPLVNRLFESDPKVITCSALSTVRVAVS